MGKQCRGGQHTRAIRRTQKEEKMKAIAKLHGQLKTVKGTKYQYKRPEHVECSQSTTVTNDQASVTEKYREGSDSEDRSSGANNVLKEEEQ